MNSPKVTVIIPTHNRPELLRVAVQSALAQTYQNLEVLVIDDASDEATDLPVDDRLRVIRLEQSAGGAGARNVGTKAASGEWITYLDDDDRLLPHMVQASMDAVMQQQRHVPPVAVLSGLQEVDRDGNVLSIRIPPAICPKGGNYFLEDIEPGRSYLAKQTLVVERDVMLSINGWDESFRSRVHSDLFLRLNPQCTLIGLNTVTYHLLSHGGTRVSGNRGLRQESFERLISKHRDAFNNHPKMFAEFVFKHALTLRKMGQTRSALKNLLWAWRLHTRHTSQLVFDFVSSRVKAKF